MRKADATELKSLCNPPQGVKDTIEAATLLLGYPREHDRHHRWKMHKRILGNTDALLNQMKTFDPKNCYTDDAKDAKTILEPYSQDIIRKISFGCEQLFIWCISAIGEVEKAGGKQREEVPEETTKS